MATERDNGELETCSLCPSSVPPVPPKQEGNREERDEDDEELQWIACSKCKKWFHSVCTVRAPEFKEETIPAELREELDASGQGEWFDWVDRVDRWYCKPCIDYSKSPDNPKPPRQPMHATLRRKRVKREAPPTSPEAKRAKGSGSPSTNGAPEEGRPKRRAALDRPDYYNMHNHNATPTRGWLDLIKNPAKHGRVIKEDNFPRVPGNLLRKEWIESAVSASDVALDERLHPPHLSPTLFYGEDREPLVVRPEDGGLAAMGGKVPAPGLTVDDVSRLVGPQCMVDVIDVATQQSSQWPLEKWAQYVKARADPRAASSSKVYNIISLEISGTDLAQEVRPPRLVSEIDWVENFWPFPGGPEATKRAAARAADGLGDGSGQPKPKAKNEWPKVQLYCLMGMRDAWTDWHVDFAASSVYYHIHSGSKVFYFIRPTEGNLAAYARWSGSHELQQSTWLPDLCDEVRRVQLHEGDTMIIPTGWIHSVYTPVDSIVFGGNFVHSYNIACQLRLRQIEIDTRVPQRFRFPFFDRLCWYVAARYRSDLAQLRTFRPTAKSTTGKPPCEPVLRGLLVLARFLIDQVELLANDGTEDKQRQLIFKRIPADIPDPAALAHELLWRVEKELPDMLKEDDSYVEKVVDRKRGKRASSSSKPEIRPEAKPMRLLDRPTPSRTWRFSPSPWDQADHPIEKTTRKVWLPRPNSEGAAEEAEEVSAMYHQSRTRTREEGGETVVEHQDLVFTERRVTWPASSGLDLSVQAGEEVQAEEEVEVEVEAGQVR